MMKKIVLFGLLLLATAFWANAQSASEVMDMVVSKYTKSKNISATFALTSPQFNAKGSIVMSGRKFRILTDDYKCWYDGKTQWVYSKATDEVNVLEPTQDELESYNPYAAIVEYKSNYDISLPAKTITSYRVNLKAKDKNAYITNLLLDVAKNTYMVMRVEVLMSDGSSQTIMFSNYKKDTSVPAGTFKFDKTLVPAATQVVDLR